MIFSKIPKRIGKKAFAWLFVYQVISFLLVGSYLKYFVAENMDSSWGGSSHFVNGFNQGLLVAFWFLVVGSILFAFTFIWNFFAPLQQLVDKSHKIRRGLFQLSKDEEFAESWGEWYQMDLALNKIFRDLKQRKADVARERSELEALVMAANDAVLAVDENLGIRYYNSPMALLFEQAEEGSWGKSLKEIFRNQNLILAFEDCLKDGQAKRVNISQILSSDATVHHFEISISPLVDEKKKRNRGAVAIFHDMTEHKKVEKIRADFVANASHELKTPVTSIQGYLDIVRSGIAKEDPSIAGAFQVIDTNMKRLNRLVSDLLDLSKIESAEEVQKQWIHVSDVTESILSELQSQWKLKKHSIDQKKSVERVFANRDYLEQTLINILENAIKYCPESSAIYIHWDEFEEGTRLRIKDNGPGIESYHQGRLFERFYRVREEVNVQGTGLGLSIVKNAMMKQNGYVDVRSVPGLGTEFICVFPNS